MKFLDDAKNAKFAADLLSAAGFNLEELRKAGDATALKSAFDSKASEGPSAGDLDAAVKENQRLETAVSTATAETTTLKATAKLHAQVVEALATSGIKITELTGSDGLSAEKFREAFSTAVAKASRTALASVGHEPLTEEISTASTAKAKAPATISGRDRVEWSFNQQLGQRN